MISLKLPSECEQTMSLELGPSHLNNDTQITFKNCFPRAKPLFCSNAGYPSNETEQDRQELRTIMEQWMQREYIELHNLQINCKENTQHNEIPDRQTLLKGLSHY